MTPEIVRNAVTAALARPAPPAIRPGPAPEQPPERAHPPIARLTLNGFRLWPAPGPEGAQTVDPSTRRFVVQHPDGIEQEVVVEIDPAMIGFVQGTTGRRLPLEHSFWSWEAEHLLNDYLWKEGKVPPSGRLTIATLGRDDLQVAIRWEGD
jgi:hypothetical protein